VYASQRSSPSAPQHSLPSARYGLLGPDFHRLDRANILAHEQNISDRRFKRAERDALRFREI